MKILAIETSCDETAIAIIEATGDISSCEVSILADSTLSQAKIHKKWGGVVPTLAKREHATHLLPILQGVLKESDLLSKKSSSISKRTRSEIEKLLEREEKLAKNLLSFLCEHVVPDIDAIAVTYGPGLEPALWVGLNFAKALSVAWNKPLVPIDHMEGHILSVLLTEKDSSYTTQSISYPALALLVSGGHTELVLIEKPLEYKILGSTRDDAVGEAFDKVARLLGLPYPGGPEISKLAEKAKNEHDFDLPRPMIHSDDYDFSFSGLKTSVLYKIKKMEKLTLDQKRDLAKQFEDAVTDVLFEKTIRAVADYDVKSVIIGGGVSANKTIRKRMSEDIPEKYSSVTVHLPIQKFSTDNAVMIAIAAFARLSSGKTQKDAEKITATGNLVLR